ncbi:plasmid mobilization protein [Embleya sp. NPDC020630]|uniref:plasmid mobilization protein n=1 Tax=Embleya sp. NPDC020630 TaxID=3363979 RepID=UPI00379CC5FF
MSSELPFSTRQVPPRRGGQGGVPEAPGGLSGTVAPPEGARGPDGNSPPGVVEGETTGAHPGQAACEPPTADPAARKAPPRPARRLPDDQPRTGAGNRRELTMKARVHPDEKRRIEDAAARANMRPSGFLAAAALAAAAGDDFTRDAQLHEAGLQVSAARTEVGRVGTNLNQITRALNIDRLASNPTDDDLLAHLREVLTDVTRTLQQLDRAVWTLTEPRR